MRYYTVNINFDKMKHLTVKEKHIKRQYSIQCFILHLEHFQMKFGSFVNRLGHPQRFTKSSLSHLGETRRIRDAAVGCIPSPSRLYLVPRLLVKGLPARRDATRLGDVASSGSCVTPTRRPASGRRLYPLKLIFILKIQKKFKKIKNIYKKISKIILAVFYKFLIFFKFFLNPKSLL